MCSAIGASWAFQNVKGAAHALRHVAKCLTAPIAMDQPEVISKIERDGGYIETLDRPGMEIYYRSCAHGYCRYSSDLWQAELYLDHLLAR